MKVIKVFIILSLLLLSSCSKNIYQVNSDPVYLEDYTQSSVNSVTYTYDPLINMQFGIWDPFWYPWINPIWGYRMWNPMWGWNNIYFNTMYWDNWGNRNVIGPRLSRGNNFYKPSRFDKKMDYSHVQSRIDRKVNQPSSTIQSKRSESVRTVNPSIRQFNKEMQSYRVPSRNNSQYDYKTPTRTQQPTRQPTRTQPSQQHSRPTTPTYNLPTRTQQPRYNNSLQPTRTINMRRSSN